jgi:hypothetical protein
MVTPCRGATRDTPTAHRPVAVGEGVTPCAPRRRHSANTRSISLPRILRRILYYKITPVRSRGIEGEPDRSTCPLSCGGGQTLLRSSFPPPNSMSGRVTERVARAICRTTHGSTGPGRLAIIIDPRPLVAAADGGRVYPG